MTMVFGTLEKKVTWRDTIKIWLVSYLGNLAGSVLLALAMVGTGLLAKQPLNNFIVESAQAKMTAPFTELFFRGILCNILVCLAVWTSAKAKEDTAKLMLIFMCLFGFIGSGLEHSVANMTLLSMGILAPHQNSAVDWIGFVHNLVPVSLGNVVGGSLVIGATYWFISSKSEKKAV
jgi:nitrite transporter NirC